MDLFWAIVGVLLLVFVWSRSLPASRPASGELRLVIDFGDGRTRTFVTDSPREKTAWERLQQAQFRYRLNLEVAAGFVPQAIEDLENGEFGRRWVWYKNGRKENKTPMELSVSGGDTLVFRFE